MTSRSGLRTTVDLDLASRTSGGCVMTYDGRETAVGTLEEMGPVDYLVIEFPECHPIGENFPLLVDLAVQILEPGRAAAILVYENRWAAPLAIALRRSGAQLVSSGRIPVQALLDALEDTEPASPTDT